MIGHENTKKQLEIAIDAARQRNMSIPHILLSGAAGCGKTSTARLLAEQTDSPFLSVVPNDLKDYKSIVKVLERLDHTGYDNKGNRTNIIHPSILFLDEVHNLPTKGQELLGIVMERFILESMKPNMYIWIPYFTLVGATTIAGKLSKPFRDRFKLNFNFQPYEIKDMIKIVRFHAKRLKVKLTPASVIEIARRSRGTPRVAVGFLERVRDKALSIEATVVTSKLTMEVFDTIGIDEEGFTKLELKILKTLFDAGLPVGLDNLSIILQEDAKSIRDFAEPYLIRKGMMLVSGKGRIITEKGAQYLNNSGNTDKLVKKEIDFNYQRS
jgi:Holliday junction DNA helicase RuvB